MDVSRLHELGWKHKKLLEAQKDRVLSSPQKVLKDKDDPQLEHALGTIQEYGNRILRVIYNKKTRSDICENSR